MAIDEALSESVRKGGNPVIRLYRWNPTAISIGYFQKLQEEVDVDACKENNIDIVRRWTGGGAVLHDEEITYSIIASEDLFPKNIIESYKVICGWVMDGLKRLGIESEYHPINDILVNNKKISGNAQTRRRGVLIQHGTILYNVDVDKMFSLLKVKDIKIKDKIISNVKERVTSISHINPKLKKGTVSHCMHLAFTKGKEFEVQVLTKEEEKRVQELKDTKYATNAWTAKR